MTDTKGRCPLCSAMAYREIDTVRTADVFSGLRAVWKAPISAAVEREHTRAELIRLLECTRCGLQHFIPGVTGSAAFYDELARGVYYPRRWEFATVARRLAPEDRVVDVGAGDGDFLASVRTRVDRVLGVDLAPAAVARMRTRGLDATHEDVAAIADKHPAAFTVACAFQTLEHVADVDALVATILRLLTPGGRLFVSLPNRERYLRARLEPLDWPPHHVSRWSVQQVEVLAQRHGLHVVNMILEEGDISAAALARQTRLLETLPARLPQRELLAKAVRRAVLTPRRYRKLAAAGTLSARGVAGHTMLAELARR